MTFNQRLAALGVDLSDLPEMAAYPIEREIEMVETIQRENDLPLDYTLRLIDIIDRMETRLINLTGERDYLAKRVQEVDPDLCDVCVYAAQPPDAPECEQCYNRDPDNFHFAGVPMDWDADGEDGLTD